MKKTAEADPVITVLNDFWRQATKGAGTITSHNILQIINGPAAPIA